MDFIDQVLVRLSDSSERDVILNEDSLKNILSAAYDINKSPVNGPYSAVYDEFVFGYIDFNVCRSEGKLSNYNNSEFTDVVLRFTDITGSNDVVTDILWRGSIVARSSASESVIDLVNFEWKSLSRVDASVIASNGSLPSDEVVLESERRSHLIDIIKENSTDPTVVTDSLLDRFLQSHNVASLSDLLEKSSEIYPANVSVRFTDDQGVPPIAQQYPISGLIVICEDDFSIRDKLVKTKLLRERMQRAGIEKPEVKHLFPKNTLVIIWIVNEEIFDDQHWPGGDTGMSTAARRIARKTSAEKWLAEEGIGLVTVVKN